MTTATAFTFVSTLCCFGNVQSSFRRRGFSALLLFSNFLRVTRCRLFY